jgi:hypothetical protein
MQPRGSSKGGWQRDGLVYFKDTFQHPITQDRKELKIKVTVIAQQLIMDFMTAQASIGGTFGMLIICIS